MNREMSTLEHMNCPDVVDLHSNERVMHGILVMYSRRDRIGAISSHKPWLVVCKKEETDYEKDTFSPAVQHVIIRLVLCLSIQQ